MGLALAAIERMTVDLNHDATSWYAKANIYYRVGRPREALATLERLVALGHGPRTVIHRLSYLNFRGSIFLLLGDTKRARGEFQQALALDPRSGQAWLSYTEVANFRGRDRDRVRALEEAYATGASNPVEGTRLAHAAGRMWHMLGDYERAFAAFSRGAALPNPPVDGDAGVAGGDVLTQSISFTRDFISHVASQIQVQHTRAIFVTGLPRSGTTLVEQILTSNPEVQHGDEIELFRILGQEIGGLDAASLQRWLNGGGDPNSLVELYLHLATERFGPDGRFVDKTLEAGNYAGLLLALFPYAPIFWLRRDPIDNGWSAFRTGFSRGVSWSSDLGDIGRRLADEDRMIEYWTRNGADKIGFVDYSTLVRDPEPQIKAIAARAGLSLVPQMLKPEETERKVATASVSQVREPINLKGLNVAEPYRKWLGPLISAYEVALKGQAMPHCDGEGSSGTDQGEFRDG